MVCFMSEGDGHWDCHWAVPLRSLQFTSLRGTATDCLPTGARLFVASIDNHKKIYVTDSDYYYCMYTMRLCTSGSYKIYVNYSYSMFS